MDDNCGEWNGLNVWVWLVSVASRMWVWLVGVGGIYGCAYQEVSVSSGCVCKEVYRYPHITYPYSSFICSFLQQHFYSLFNFLNIFRSCSCS